MVSLHWTCLLVSPHAKASWWQMQWTLIILGFPFLSNADMPRFLPTITEAPSEARLKGSGRPGHLWLFLLLCSRWLFVHLVIQCLSSPLRHFNQEVDFYFRVSDILNKHDVLFNLNIGHIIHHKATAPCFFWSLDDLPFDDPANCLEDFSDWPQGLVSEMFQFFQAYRPDQLQHRREFSIGRAIQKSTVQYVMLVDVALINFFLEYGGSP